LWYKNIFMNTTKCLLSGLEREKRL
jgi:hypothetical protein